MILNLSGELISDEWAELYRYYDYNAGFFCPADVRNAIAQLQPGEELELQINSVGGLVDGGSEIYSLLEACQNPTKAVIQSLAASAASYMIQACDRIEIHLPAQMMIHLAQSGASGNKHTFQRAAQMLDACDRSILSVYSKRCGDKATSEQLETLMENETYLTSTDALSIGLVDAIVGQADNDEPEILVASSMNNTVRAMRVIPDIRDLMARKASEEIDQLWSELFDEKNRFEN